MYLFILAIDNQSQANQVQKFDWNINSIKTGETVKENGTTIVGHGFFGFTTFKAQLLYTCLKNTILYLENMI